MTPCLFCAHPRRKNWHINHNHTTARKTYGFLTRKKVLLKLKLRRPMGIMWLWRAAKAWYVLILVPCHSRYFVTYAATGIFIAYILEITIFAGYFAQNLVNFSVINYVAAIIYLYWKILTNVKILDSDGQERWYPATEPAEIRADRRYGQHDILERS